MKEDEIKEELHYTNFKPAFMTHCKIVECKNKFWKETGEKIQSN